MAGANKIRALLAARQDKDRGDDVKAFGSGRHCYAGANQTMAAAAAAGRRVLAGANVVCVYLEWKP